jgi:GTP pyrophosphokinase
MIYETDHIKESKEIVRRYRNLLKVWHTRKEPEDKQLVRKAFDLAMDAHKDMRRRTGEPYIYHPLEVATIAAGEIGLGTTSIVSALLHDVVEDTDYTLDYIKTMFGSEVGRIIDGLTKIQEMFDLSKTTPQAENFRKILLTLSDDVRVILVKLADRLHNMRTLDAMPEDKQLKIASEGLYLFAPLAHRLGLYAIKSELEDLALKYTEPDIYQSIQKDLADTRTSRTRFINRFIYPIKKEIASKGIPFKIEAREKSIYSIWQKMKRKEIPFDEVYDIFAVRVILDVEPEKEKSECWRVYSIITDHYRPNQDRLRDWISIPKANGYEALHTTVMSQEGRWVEVQIRTKRMDEIAEKGYAAHWKYKESDNNESGLEEWLNRVRDIFKENDSSALEFMDDFELNLFTEEIFLFTPRGDLVSLPKGSTALDFAYSIHSDIGDTSIGAKVNHALKPLNHLLKSGDQVEIITSGIQEPQEEWLDYVVTSRARNKIKTALKEKRKVSLNRGKDIISKLFEELSLDFNDQEMKRFAKMQELASVQDLYLMAARGDIGVDEVKDFSQNGQGRGILSYISRPFSRGVKDEPVKSINETIFEKLKNKPESLLLSDNVDDIEYSIAQCCQPIPGDDVVGFISPDDDIKIHRTNCKEAIRFMSKYGNRVIKAKWKYKEAVGFLAGIRLKGIDKKGLVLKIAQIITEKHNISIRSLHMDTSEGMTEGKVMLYVQDSKSLNKLIDNLRKIKEIVKVSRLDRMD